MADWTNQEVRNAKRHLKSVSTVAKAIEKHETEGGEQTPNARRRVAAKALKTLRKKGGRNG